jgi:ATP-binding cassette, subfamily C, bacterial CydC
MSATASFAGPGFGRRRSVLRLGPTIGRHRGRFLLTVAASAGAQFGGVAAAGVGAWMVGSVATGAEASDLFLPAALLVVAVLVRSASVWLEMWVAHDLAYRIMADIRVDVFDGLERLAPGWLLGQRTGDVGTAAMSDVENLEWFYAHAVAQFVVTSMIPVAAIGVLGVVDPLLALVLTPFVLLVCTVPLWLSRLADRQGDTLRGRVASLNSDAVDGVQGLRELVVFGAAHTFRDRLRRRSVELTAAQRAHGARSGLEGAVADALISGAMIAMLTVGAWMVATGRVGYQGFPVAVVVTGAALGSIVDVVGGLRNLGVLRATAERVFTIVDTPARVVDDHDAQGELVGSYDVAFDGVRFRYSIDGPEVLRGVSFRIEAGETVALVGASGAGKSTCAHLLMRLWDVGAGAVSVAGIDVRHVTQHTLRDTVGLVAQDPYLFNSSIADNIRLGAPEATDEQVETAARRAHVLEFAAALPDGLHTIVGERGAQLSGGQRQRIAIARALLRDTPVLILDEALSSVDAEGERSVRAALDDARAGRTTLVIAHRLSTIRSATRVVLLADGVVNATGTHDELFVDSDVYRRLVETQLSGSGPDQSQ